MQALFDRLSPPFGERKIYRIQTGAGSVLRNHLPDFASRSEQVSLYLRSQDKSVLKDNAGFVDLILSGFSEGNQRVEKFRARLLNSIEKLLMLLNAGDPDKSFHTLLSERLDTDFDNEFEAFLRFKNLMTDRLRAHSSSGSHADFKSVAADKADRATDEFLLFLKNKRGRKLICGEIAKIFNAENSPRKRGLESIADQLQRIVSTKVYSDPDASLKTIMNFGLPSIVTVSAGNGNQYDRICRLAKESVEAFEPRLAEPDVYFVMKEDTEHPVDCIIQGRMANGSETEIIKFPMKI
ncbi:MAG: GPW/gp25 family protein [Desulfobacterales bacterium]|nr:GPW/gp25 family protein [Desulfobacterales bacterium]